VRELLMTMRRDSIGRSLAAAIIAIVVAACGGGDGGMDDMEGMGADTAAPAAPMPAGGMPTVMVVSPAEGDTVAAGALTVTLDVGGMSIAMAGDTTPNTGHHHLFLDRDVSSPGIAIPAEPGYIVHMGDASTSYTFENVTPGEHRLIAVVGDGLHIPLQPWVVDTVRFVVR
jgi:hypothetical protein